jgi:hypothetical protein
MEDPIMSLIRNGYAVSTRRAFLGALFSALLALALFGPGAATAQEGKQIKLTDKHIQSFLAAYKDLAELYNGTNPEPDPKMEAQAEAIVKKNGFANLDEYDDVSLNISMILPGIDPQTKKFTQPPEQIKREIAALKANKSISAAEKKEDLAQLEAALKIAKPIQFKENIALVLKYFDQLLPLMQEQDSNLRPAD